MIRQFNEGSYSILKNALDASSLKSKVIANNIANVNTENYKRYEVNFAEALNNKKDKNLKKTHEKHIDSNILGSSLVYQDNTTSMKTDGNNVDIDMEKVEQATNSLMYNTLISRVSGKLSAVRSVISGGGK